jgi:hypothetical protein
MIILAIMKESTMFRVNAPREMNETFARAFNTRDVNNLLDLYEANAQLRVDASETTRIGIADIGAELQGLLQTPGTMVPATISASSTATSRCCGRIGRWSTPAATSWFPAVPPKSYDGNRMAHGAT